MPENDRRVRAKAEGRCGRYDESGTDDAHAQEEGRPVTTLDQARGAVAGPSARDRRTVRRGALPAWPVTWLFVGFPVIWLAGLTPFAVPMFGMLCAFLMAVRGGIRLPRLWMPWLGFVVWMLTSAVMIDTAGRMLGFAQRWTTVFGATLIALYVYNAPERLTRIRLLRSVAWFWGWITVGGYLGLLQPYGRVNTPMLRLMPSNIANNEYVRELLSPRFAEVQKPYGATQAFVRPAAPFPYTNGWGHAFVLMLPLMAALFVLADRRLKGVVVLMVLAAVPIALATLNRGIFVGVFVGTAAMLVRYRRRIRLGHVMLAAVPLAGLAVFVMASGALDRISQRTSTSSTTQDRASIYREAFTRTLDSPLLGYGAPRPSSTLDVSVGTQGHFWYVMFSHGFVGLAFFLATIWGLALVTRRASDLPTALVQTPLVVVSVMIMFYGLEGMNLLLVLVIGALALRPGPKVDVVEPARPPRRTAVPAVRGIPAAPGPRPPAAVRRPMPGARPGGPMPGARPAGPPSGARHGAPGQGRPVPPQNRPGGPE